MDATAGDLSILVERLRTLGFRVDTRQYLAAHELLLALAARGQYIEDDPRALALYLAPIFCTQSEEQARFGEEIARWKGRPPPLVPGPTPLPSPFEFWRRWQLSTLAALAVFSVAVGVLLHKYMTGRPVTIPGVVEMELRDGTVVPAAGAKVLFGMDLVPVDNQGRFELKMPRTGEARLLRIEIAGYLGLKAMVSPSMPQPLRVLLVPASKVTGQTAPMLPALPPVASAQAEAASTDSAWRWSAIATATTLAGLCLFTLAWLLARAKRLLALKRLETLGDAENVALKPEVDAVVAIGDHDLRRLASALRRPREQADVELSMSASVDATLRAGGLFAPVYSARRATPEYLVLVQQRSARDHWATWADEWRHILSLNGVATDRFIFHDDPRTCYSDAEKREAHRLKDVVSRHHRATLFLFAETSTCFDRFRNAPAPWLAEFQSLQRRVLFVAEAPFRWGEREWALSAEGFIVLPAGREGFDLYTTVTGDWRIEQMLPARYARPYPAIVAHAPGAWLDRNAPPEGVQATLIDELRGYLGPAGFRWLCACAVYPEISLPLTLQLAVPETAGTGQGAHTLDALPALARLPWFRHGFMPDWLRRALLAQLTPERQRPVRHKLESLLERLVSGAGPAPKVSTRAIDSAADLRIHRWLSPTDVMKAAPPGSPLRDGVFLGFMSSGGTDELAFGVRDVFRTLFRRGAGRLAELPPADVAAQRRLYWRKNLSMIAALTAVWVLVTFVPAWYASQFNTVTFLGFPLGFYVFAQGALVVFLLILGLYVRYMKRLGATYGIKVEEDR